MVVYIKEKGKKMLPKYVKLYLYLTLILMFLSSHMNIMNSQRPYKANQRVGYRR